VNDVVQVVKPEDDQLVAVGSSRELAAHEETDYADQQVDHADDQRKRLRWSSCS
jgi:hypothetical protein